MKKFLSIAALMFAIVFSASAQESKDSEPASKSTTVEFLAKDGTLLQKDFYPLGAVKGVDCEVLIITDVLDGTKVGCVRLETTYRSQYSSDTYIGTLDADELDACIQSLNYIKNDVLNTKPDNYVEFTYSTKDGVRIGAFYNQTKATWTTYVRTKSYTSRSAEYFSSDNLDTLISTLESGKRIIQNTL